MRVSALVHPSVLPPTTIGSGGEKNDWGMWLPSGSVIDPAEICASWDRGNERAWGFYYPHDLKDVWHVDLK